jgi:protein-disulfide isomerase
MAPKQPDTRRPGSTPVVKATKGSKKSFYLAIGLAAIVGIAVLSYLSSQKGKAQQIVLSPDLPAVTSSGYVLGSPTAPIELVEFGDFECPSCARFAELTEPDLRQQYVNTGKVRVRFIDFPLSMHANTLNASNAAACADEQGKFWELHDLLYSTQDQWNGQATKNPDKYIKELARRIPGMDGSKIDECIDSRRNLAKVQSHLKMAVDRGLNSTPSFVIGQTVLNLRQNSGDDFKQLFDSLLARADTSKAVKKP